MRIQYIKGQYGHIVTISAEVTPNWWFNKGTPSKCTNHSCLGVISEEIPQLYLDSMHGIFRSNPSGDYWEGGPTQHMTYLYSIFAGSQPNCTAVQVEFVILYLATSTNFESQLPEDTQQEIAKGQPVSTGDAVGFGKLSGQLFPPVWGCMFFLVHPWIKLGILSLKKCMPKSTWKFNSPPRKKHRKRHKFCSQTPWVTCVNKHQDPEKKT